MANVGFIKNNEGNIMPITRGELVLDSSGNMALHSPSFVATKKHPGLLSNSDKEKLDGLKKYAIQGLNLPNVYVIKLLNDIDNTYTDAVIPPMEGPTTNASGKAGLVPIPTPVDINKFLKSDGTWDSPTGIPTKLFIGEINKLNNQESTSTYLKVFSGNTLLNQYNITGIGLASVSNDASGNITINVPNVHYHTTSHISSLQGYTKGENTTNLASTDTLNQALSKLECKTDLGILAYNWYQSVTNTDTDGYINKWGEIVDFLDSVKQGTDILDEFVTRKTIQEIEALKVFNNVTIFRNALILRQPEKNSLFPNIIFSRYNGDNRATITVQDSDGMLGPIYTRYQSDGSIIGVDTLALTGQIPTKISDLANDSNFVKLSNDDGPSDYLPLVVNDAGTLYNTHTFCNPALGSLRVSHIQFIDNDAYLTIGGRDESNVEYALGGAYTNHLFRGDVIIGGHLAPFDDGYSLGDSECAWANIHGIMGHFIEGIKLGKYAMLGIGADLGDYAEDMVLTNDTDSAVWLGTTGRGDESSGVLFDRDTITFWCPHDKPVCLIDSDTDFDHEIPDDEQIKMPLMLNKGPYTGTVYLTGVTGYNRNRAEDNYLYCGTMSTSGVRMLNGNSLYAYGGFFESSDSTLKNFGVDVHIDFEQLKSIPKKYFTWKNDEEHKLHIGTSAQDVQNVYPELVNEDEQGILHVNYSKLSILALAAVDVLHEEIAELKERISKLENMCYGKIC